MKEIIFTNKDQITPMHRNEHEPYEFYRYEAVKFEAGNQCIVDFYEIPPGKSNHPYHYHSAMEEIFYIISGQGQLRTPEGERTVRSGDVIVFPPSEKGAHKMTNTSDTEMLTYLDIDTSHLPEVVVYPDSNKVGVIGSNFGEMYMKGTGVGYYTGE